MRDRNKIGNESEANASELRSFNKKKLKLHN